MLEKMKKDNKGFTLVELIVVIAILGILVAVLAPQYMKYIEKARKATDKTTAEEILTACKTAAADEAVKADFTATWDGDKVTITGDLTAITDIEHSLQITSGTANSVVAKCSSTTINSKTYVVKYTAATASSDEATVAVSTTANQSGWWS